MRPKPGANGADRAALRRQLIQVVRLLATPIDFPGLVQRGALAPGPRGWYELLRLELLPAHARHQIREARQERRGEGARIFLKFSNKKANADAARLYEQLTGK